MRKPIIAVDVDDVLADSVPGFLAFSNERWGTNLTVEDYDEHWAQMWQVDEQEHNRRWSEYNGERVIRHHSPIVDAETVLRQLKQRYDIVIATSRPKLMNSDTVAWLETHYSGIFSNIYHSGIYDSDGTDNHQLTKADLCEEIGADYLIDDQPKHCNGVAESGIKAVLFGDNPWSRDVQLVPGVTKCASWADVLEYFEQEAQA